MLMASNAGGGEANKGLERQEFPSGIRGQTDPRWKSGSELSPGAENQYVKKCM